MLGWNKSGVMVEIIRIRPSGKHSKNIPYIPFEIKLEKSRDEYLHREVVELLREESERILKNHRDIAFDSIAFYFYGGSVTIEILAKLIIVNSSRLPRIFWEGKHDSHVPPSGSDMESVGLANETFDCLADPQRMHNKQISMKQAEQCARDLVDIYHARYHICSCDDFEHCNALLPRKNSDGRTRTDLEISVLNECDKKIARELENIAKRSDACVARLREMFENHRRVRMSYKLSSDSCEQWYRHVGIHIERVLTHRRSCGSIDAQKESELQQLYPKGWFEYHVFPHLEEIHPENRGSAPEDVINTSGRNDTNFITELEDRNVYNSHMVSKAIQCLHKRNEMHKQEILKKDLERYKGEGEIKMSQKKMQREIEELRGTLAQQNQTGDLDGLQSSQEKTIEENVIKQMPLPVQDLVELSHLSERIEKENKNDAPKKDRSKAMKTQPKRVYGGSENIYQKEYRYTKKR